MDGQDKEQDMVKGTEIRMKSGGQGQGQVCGRWGQVSQGLEHIGSR